MSCTLTRVGADITSSLGMKPTAELCHQKCRPKLQTMQHCTGHWNPFAGRRPALGTGVPAEGRHWPALGARRSAVLPAEGRRWLGRRPGTAARAVCARRSEQCAMYGARLSSMRTLYIYIIIYTAIIYKYTYYTAVYIYYEY